MKSHHIRALGALLGFSLALGLPGAQSVSPAAATLDDCFQASLKQSETLASQYQAVVQAEEHYKQALGSVLPSVVAGASAFWQNQSPNPASPIQQNTLRLTATQPLFQGLREVAALRQTKDLLKSQKLAHQWASLQLFADTATAFNLALFTQKNLAELRNQHELFDERAKFLAGWVSIGRAQDADVLSVQTARAQIGAQIELASYQVSQSRELLAFLTGLPRDLALDDTQALPAPLQSQETYLSALDQMPVILAAVENFKAAEEGVNLAWGQHLPSVVASADYYPYRFAPYTDVNWDAVISVTLPIFLGGTVNSQIRSAKSQKEQARLALSAVRRAEEQSLRDGYAKLSSDLAQESALKEAADLARRTYKAQAKNFELGLVTNLDVLQALVTQVTTQQALDAAHYAAFTDFQNLQALCGRVSNLPEYRGEP